MIGFNRLYLEVDKMFKDVETRLAYDNTYSLDKADIDTTNIYNFIIACGWDVNEFKKAMILSLFEKN